MDTLGTRHLTPCIEVVPFSNANPHNVYVYNIMFNSLCSNDKAKILSSAVSLGGKILVAIYICRLHAWFNQYQYQNLMQIRLKLKSICIHLHDTSNFHINLSISQQIPNTIVLLVTL